MKKKRGLLESIFGKVTQKIEAAAQFRLLNTWDNTFTPYNGNQWDMAEVRAAVNSFAKHVAKIAPRHIRRGGGTYEFVDDYLDNILQFKPNPYMTAFACYYKIAADYKLTNNAFLYPVWESGKVTAIYPIMAQQVSLLEYKGEMYCEFRFATGKTHIVPYDEVVHIKNYYYENDIFGSDNRALSPVLETAHTFNQSMSKFAELVAVVRGILRVNGAPKTEDLNKRRDDFVNDNMRLGNNGSGVIVTDSKYDYEPLKDSSLPIPKGQLDYVKNEIYDYFGTNENIVQSKFNENEWNAFYESEIKPFCIQLSQALTNCLFTPKERGFGNEVLIEGNRLQYASTQTKISAGNFLTNIGAASLDQILEIFNMAPIGGEEGKRRVQTLNSANAKIVDDYQLNKIGSVPSKKEETEESENGD